MIETDNTVQHMVTDVQIDGKQYGVVMAIFNRQSMTTELRWATGNKEVYTETL